MEDLGQIVLFSFVASLIAFCALQLGFFTFLTDVPKFFAIKTFWRHATKLKESTKPINILQAGKVAYFLEVVDVEFDFDFAYVADMLLVEVGSLLFDAHDSKNTSVFSKKLFDIIFAEFIWQPMNAVEGRHSVDSACGLRRLR